MSDSAESTHRSRGVGEETVVVCEDDGGSYGPDGDRKPLYCPYCGASALDDDHDIILDGDEVTCEHTNQANYRYCPGCGEEVDR